MSIFNLIRKFVFNINNYLLIITHRIMKNNKVNLLDFCEYLINHFAYRGEPLTHKKMQKILYYVQAWHLVYFNGDIIFDEKPQAWRHGPVYPSIYVKYRDCGFEHIMPKTDISLDDLELQISKFNLTEKQREYLKDVLNYYGSKNAIELEILSHSESPWLNARKGLAFLDKCNNEISFNDMQTYYSSLQSN